MAERLVLVTGATGYIAGQLIPRLLDLGYRVRCLARDPHRLQARAWFPYVEVVPGDVMLPSTLPAALEGVSAETFRARFGLELMDIYGKKINRLLELNLLEWNAGRLRLTKRARLLGNQVFVEFVGE